MGSRRRLCVLTELAVLAAVMTSCGTGKADDQPCRGTKVYPSYTDEPPADLFADPKSAERFKASVARYGSEAERRAVQHVTRLSQPGEEPEYDLVTMFVETDVPVPPPIDDANYTKTRKAHDRWETEGKIITQALAKWWRGTDPTQNGEPTVWVQYKDRGSLIRETYDWMTTYCMPSESPTGH